MFISFAGATILMAEPFIKEVLVTFPTEGETVRKFRDVFGGHSDIK